MKRSNGKSRWLSIVLMGLLNLLSLFTCLNYVLAQEIFQEINQNIKAVVVTSDSFVASKGPSRFGRVVSCTIISKDFSESRYASFEIHADSNQIYSDALANPGLKAGSLNNKTYAGMGLFTIKPKENESSVYSSSLDGARSEINFHDYSEKTKTYSSTILVKRLNSKIIISQLKADQIQITNVTFEHQNNSADTSDLMNYSAHYECRLSDKD